jgi:hypothetical protein
MSGQSIGERHGAKFGWRSALGAIAFLIGAICIFESSAEAVPEVTKDSFKLAQVGVSSQVNAPIPLNLRPRTHIPLPTNSRSNDEERHFGSDAYGYPHDHDHYHYHRGNQNNGTVIIINPANQSSYESYSDRDGYIRIIRK